MTLLIRIYYNAVFGALGGLLGWMLFGVFGDKNPSSQHALLIFNQAEINSLLGGAIIGGMIGYFVVGVEAIRDRSFVRFARLASYGVVLGAVGGAVGMYVGDKVNYFLNWLGEGWLVEMLARGIGWTFLGVAIGLSEGVAARSLGRLSYSTIGGAIGGFVGGCLFIVFYLLALRSGGTTYVFSALGLCILGACIGSLAAFVPAVFQPACVRVLRGWQEGREYPLDRESSLLGREEHADIALFRDMKVEKEHAYIKRSEGGYVLVNNDAPPDWTLINDIPVPQSRELQDGDRIQLGEVILRFHRRAAKADRAKRLRPPVVAQPSPVAPKSRK